MEYDLLQDVDGSMLDSPATFSEDNLGGQAKQKDTGWMPVVSSMIAAVRYVSAENTMYVRFPNGTEYTYSVPENVFRELISAPSVGSYFRRNIYNRYRYARV